MFFSFFLIDHFQISAKKTEWIDYRTKVTRSLLRKLATITWLLEVCTQVLITLMATSLESKARKTVLELARMRKSLKVQPLVDVAASFKHEKSFRGLLERGMC